MKCPHFLYFNVHTSIMYKNLSYLKTLSVSEDTINSVAIFKRSKRRRTKRVCFSTFRSYLETCHSTVANTIVFTVSSFYRFWALVIKHTLWKVMKELILQRLFSLNMSWHDSSRIVRMNILILDFMWTKSWISSIIFITR